MANIIGKDLIIRELGKWFPMGCRVVNITFISNSFNDKSSLELTIIPYVNQSKKITLHFSGVDKISILKIKSDGINCALLKYLIIQIINGKR
ncbi:hypothetical protein OXPF_40060 [Oxobacter pfennigii]|uniref:Uncharacterized protein n=1 Tax=Oxobacter pfennigii TaxID=36849 RepID=A0A0P8YRK5_9CLOT|nr:hypothetical protein [Oxobacter pfennigii]KPU42222.1 hypothetical protein OXPF_40060 [Oxobacter pfennigii]